MGNTLKKSRVAKELEPFTTLNGLYSSCPYGPKRIRKMVLEQQVAPLFRGGESKNIGFEECPICFLYYPCLINHTTCCQEVICTECYLQTSNPNHSISCPYCKCPSLTIAYKPVTEEKQVVALMRQLNAIFMESVPISPKEPVVLASVHDRCQIQEDAILQSETVALERMIASATSQPAIESGSWSTIITSAGSPQDIARVEEMMLMEAIRQSILDNQLGNDESHDEEEAVNTLEGISNLEIYPEEHEYNLTSNQSTSNPDNHPEDLDASNSDNNSFDTFQSTHTSFQISHDNELEITNDRIEDYIKKRRHTKSDSSLGSIVTGKVSLEAASGSRDDEKVDTLHHLQHLQRLKNQFIV